MSSPDEKTDLIVLSNLNLAGGGGSISNNFYRYLKLIGRLVSSALVLFTQVSKKRRSLRCLKIKRYGKLNVLKRGCTKNSRTNKITNYLDLVSTLVSL
jgi:hypothetical protein